MIKLSSTSDRDGRVQSRSFHLPRHQIGYEKTQGFVKSISSTSYPEL